MFIHVFGLLQTGFFAVVSNMVRVRFEHADPLGFPILRYHSDALEKRDGWWL
jgi:hypothetical protein